MKVLVFRKKQVTCHLLLGSHLKVQIHLLRVTTGMAVNTHKTFSPNPSSLGIVQWRYSGVLTKFWKCRETCFCEPRHWGLMAKEVFSNCESSKAVASNLPEKHTGSFLSLYNKRCSQDSNFHKETNCLPLLLENHLIVQIHLIKLTTDMVDNTHRTLSPDLFSHGIAYCVLVESLHSSQIPRENVLVKRGIGSWWQIIIFPSVPEKHTGSFSLNYNSTFCRDLIFLK